MNTKTREDVALPVNGGPEDNEFTLDDDNNPSTSDQGTYGDDGPDGNAATGGFWTDDMETT